MLDAAYEDLDNTFVLAVNVFSSLMEMRGGHPGHARRVADLSKETAKRMGMSDRDVRDVYLAALVHDVGTIGFPDAMLAKPVSTYNAEEHQRYRRHTIEGETALMALVQLQGVAKIVRQHHERVDGKGFPDGLAGNAITMGARIVAAASDLDELAHGALGEVNQSADNAHSLLKGGIDTHYDRAVIDTLLQVAIDMADAAKDDVHIDVRDLRPGMVLARAVLSSKGAILLAKGYVFDERVVKQVTNFSSKEGVHLTLWVQSDSIPEGTKLIEPSKAHA